MILNVSTNPAEQHERDDENKGEGVAENNLQLNSGCVQSVNVVGSGTLFAKRCWQTLYSNWWTVAAH